MTAAEPKSKRRSLISDLILVYILLAGAYFRLTGIDWGEYQYLHPDERFLVWVGSDIQPVDAPAERLGAPPTVENTAWRAAYPEDFPDCQKWGGYFDASCSPLNPNNRGHGFYVYGTLPLFLARYVVEALHGHSGFNEMTDVGRALSALFDLLTVFLVYLIAARLHNRRVGLMAAAFSAVTVLTIQQAHFFTVDTFLNFFTTLAIYFAVCVADSAWWQGAIPAGPEPGDVILAVDSPGAAGAQARELLNRFTRRLRSDPLTWLSVSFGVALGCAVSSKLNAAPVAVMLPAAFGILVLRTPTESRMRRAFEALFYYLPLAAVVSVLVFRLFQPYAFMGPGFFGVKPNPQWVSNIREQRIQAAGDVDFPPAIQWARRPVWFSGENMVLWGLGLPLGILAWAGFVWAGWRLLADKTRLKEEWKHHALLWGWTAFYFVWQSLAFNPTMRYQLPVYPILAVFAGWAVVALYERGRPQPDPEQETAAGEEDDFTATPEEPIPQAGSRPLRTAAVLLGGLVLLATTGWAYAFTRIYVHPTTRIAAARWIYQNVPGPINVHIQSAGETFSQPLPFPQGFSISFGQPYLTYFTASHDGFLAAVTLGHARDVLDNTNNKTLLLKVDDPNDASPPASAAITSAFAAGAGLPAGAMVSSGFQAGGDPRGDPYTFTFDPPLQVRAGIQYELILEAQAEGSMVTLAGAAPANESTWDDGLPLRIDGYDGYGGIYQPGLNFEMYWDDNAEKYERFVTTLNQADYIFISSSRQWGSLPRVPERYPLTSAYYRRLLGCPPERAIEWCYATAQVGSFQGALGFDLVQVFDESPRLGPLVFNTQFAEEAFTVYDHPKVFIFRKSANYDPAQVRSLLGAVDYSQAIHVTPKRAGSQPANLMLPPERWQEQQAGGTWAQIFNTRNLFNRYPALGAVLWYIALAGLGFLMYPLVRLALSGLPDGAYPLGRAAGLLLLAYLSWLAGSAGIPFTRLTISLVLLLMLGASLGAAYAQRGDLRQEWNSRRRYFLMVEGLFLAFFIFDLLIRLGNPDLWHPWKGGEKPMDFAYLNAVLKSTTFPPYDPWYAGGYLNYYYYGFVYVGVLVKWLGITPAVAYNLILPSVFAMIALGAFSIGWNILSAWRERSNAPAGQELEDSPLTGPPPATTGRLPFIGGLAGALGMAVLGNLGTVRMVFQGYQRLAAPDGVIEGVGLLTRWVWAFRGALQTLAGASLPYGIGDWYWNPSRAIPAPNDVEPITEFPFFTVLYGDPHAHLFALPIALLVLAWALSLLLGRGWKGRSTIHVAAGFLLGGLAIGAMYPVNLSDIYTYLPLGVAALVYALWRNFEPEHARWLPGLPANSKRLLLALAGAALLAGLSVALYQPYSAWYGQGYTKIDIWKGTHTPVSAYLTHWGLFLFVIVSWMVWETRQWMAETPVSALRKLEKYRAAIYLSLGLLFGVLLALVYLKVRVGWLVLPLALWAGVLLLRPNQPDLKRFVLFLVGTGLVLSLMVEAVVVVGDIGRMNTVFKFYLQGWTLFAVSAAAALGWLLPAIPGWYRHWRVPWQLAFAALVAGTALFTLLGGMAKIKDRMAPEAPHTLDGMAYMQYATYAQEWGVMNLDQDYRAIRWMQENVTGSPVIVEANLRNLYRWGSRFSIYTGLPGVVGWEWHQQQQRALLPGSWVSARIDEVNNFYTTTDLEAARQFLRKYNVRYIILGQQERGHYNSEGPDNFVAPEGLAKFPAAEGALWRTVYQDGDTVIYESLDWSN